MVHRGSYVGKSIGPISNQPRTKTGHEPATAPTLEDYARTKAKVEGAGALGRFLWTLGGVLLAIALWIVARWDGLMAWLTSR